MTEREELKPCKCGGNPHLVSYSDDGSPEGVGRVGYFRVVCNVCGSHSDRSRYPWSAMKKWNDDTLDYKNCKCGCQPENVRYEGWVYIECRECGISERGHWSDDARENWNRRMEQEG